MTSYQGIYRLVTVSLTVALLSLGSCARHGADMALEATSPPPLEVTTAGELKHKIGVFAFENQSRFIGPRIATSFQNNFIFALTDECPDLIIADPTDPAFSTDSEAVPRKSSGAVDNMQIIQIGRRNGCSAIVAATLNSINANEEDTGMLWFKDKYYYFRVQIHFDVYDTETGAKLLDESLWRDIEVDGFDVDLFRERQRIEPYVVEEAFEEITATFSQMVCDAIQDQPWKGYVTEVEDDGIIVSAGESAGLRPGIIMSVYHSDKVLGGAGGQQFFLPGAITAKIQIQRVQADRSRAVQIAGGPVQPGDLVQPE